MDKMQYPRGLVRYTSINALERNYTAAEVKRHFFRPRVLIYSTILLIITVVVLTSLLMRTPLKVNVIRDRGALAREVEGAFIENTYRLQINNTGNDAHVFLIKPVGQNGLENLKALVFAGFPGRFMLNNRFRLGETCRTGTCWRVLRPR